MILSLFVDFEKIGLIGFFFSDVFNLRFFFIELVIKCIFIYLLVVFFLVNERGICFIGSKDRKKGFNEGCC